MPDSETATVKDHSPTLSPPESSLFNVFQDILDSYDKVNMHIESAHGAEIQGKTETAIQNYSEGLQLIEQILSVEDRELLSCTLEELGRAKEIKEKIILLKEDVTERLEMLKSKASFSKDQPDEDASPKLSVASKSDSYFQEFDFPNPECGVEATEIFTIPDGVLMFNISPEGVATPSAKWQTLHVVKFNHGSMKLSNGAFIPPAFLQVGDWVYPLMPGLSPALITKFRTYIFPDVLSVEEGAAVAIVLPRSISRIDRMTFEVILDYFTVLDNKHIQKTYLQALSDMDIVPAEEPKSSLNIASIISFAITVATSLTAWVITTGALLIIWLAQLAFGYIRSQITPAQEPSTVHPGLRQGITYMKSASTATVQVKQYVVDTLGESTMSIALTIAPIIKEQGEKVLPEFLTSHNNHFVRGTMQITSSTVKGLSRVSKSVDYASMSLMTNLTRESVDVIHHRFGEDVGTFASDTLSTAHFVIRTANSARNMNLTRFAVRAGRPHGKAVLHHHAQSIDGSTSVVTILTPAVFVKANAILHNSTQMYAQILETIGRSKLDLRKSRGSSQEEARRYRRASVDGVIRPKSGKMGPYCPVHSKNRMQDKRFSLPTSALRFDPDAKQLQCTGHKSTHNLLSKVLSVSAATSTVSNLDHLKSHNEKFQVKYQAIAEDAAARMAHSDFQSKIMKRKGSLYKS